MKKQLSHLFLLSITLLLFLSSCEKDENSVEPEASVSGEWMLTTVKNDINFQSDTDTENESDFTGEGLFFNFNADGSYSTNASINLGSVSKAENTISGNYTRNNDQLEIDYTFADFGISATLKLDITLLTADKLQLTITEETLVQAFNDNLGQLSVIEKAAAELFLGNIVSLKTEINLEK